MKKYIFLILAAILAAGMMLSGCSSQNGAPSASLSGTPYITAGPSSTTTINVTPLPNGVPSTVPTVPNNPLTAPSVS